MLALSPDARLEGTEKKTQYYNNTGESVFGVVDLASSPCPTFSTVPDTQQMLK